MFCLFKEKIKNKINYLKEIEKKWESITFNAKMSGVDLILLKA